MKLIYYLTRKTLKSDSLIQDICMFLQKETSHCRDNSVILFATSFIQKMAESLDSMYSSIPILLVPSFPLLNGFAVQSLLT